MFRSAAVVSILFCLPFFLSTCRSDEKQASPPRAQSSDGKNVKESDAHPVQDTAVVETALNHAASEQQESDPMSPRIDRDGFILIASQIPENFTRSNLKSAAAHTKLIALNKRTETWIDPEEWLKRHQFKAPNLPYFDGTYMIEGQPGGSEFDYEYRLLVITKPDNTKLYYDFTHFMENPEIEAFIRHVIIKDDIIYISFSHLTYAESNPDTAFILAMDFSGNILWRSRSLVCNTVNFFIDNETIICGYGFARESDHLYTLDIHTGKLVHKYPISSKPEYIFVKDEKLYVLTYNTEYEFTLKLPN